MLRYTDGVTGLLTVIYGPMRSAKSAELIKMCSDAELYQNKKVIIFKPSIDTRWGDGAIISRVGSKATAYNIPSDLSAVKEELSEKGTLGGHNLLDKDIVAFDETQFFSADIVDIVGILLKNKKDVIVAGLNLNYTGCLIGHMGRLLLMADEPIQKHAYCACCGRPAMFTQRLTDGNPVTELELDNDVEIGEDQYEPRCRHCFVSK